MGERRAAALGVVCIGLLAGTPAAARADAAAFYEGKQITFIVGTAAGGGNDLYARVLSQFMPRHIPGRPAIIVQNMPGADGATAGANVYNLAARDGTVIATAPSSMLLAEALSPSQARFDSPKFGWIGTVAPMTDVLAVFKSTGIDSLDAARTRDVVIGATGSFALSALEPAVANALLGTRFRIVKGYSGGDTMNVAMERHEIEGRTNQWASWKALRPDWISGGKLSYLLQYGPREGELASVPTLADLVHDPADRAIVDLLQVAQYVGRAVFAPPDVPAERMAILRDAFDRTMRDPDFVDRMRALNLDLRPESGTEVRDEIVRAMANRVTVVRDLKARLKLN